MSVPVTGRVARRARRMEYACVTLLPALVTAGRFWNGFVFDDVYVITNGTFIHDSANLPLVFTRHAMVASSLDQAVGHPPLDTYRPVPLLTFFWDAWLSGQRPWAYHLTNMVLHAVCCALLLALLRRLVPRLPSVTRAALACMFGLSPWLSEAHVWINGRSDPLMTGFLLLATWAALTKPTLRSRAAVFGGCLLALLAKEVAVLALPFVVLAPFWARGECDALPEQRLSWRSFGAVLLSPTLALLVYLGMRMAALRGLRTHDDGAQLLAALSHLPVLWADGLYRALVPGGYVLRSLRDDYAGLGVSVVALSVLVCIGGVTLGTMSRRRAPLVGFGLAWFAFTLSPVALISTVLWPGFGRYLYLPTVGLVLALAGGLEALVALRPALRRVALGLPVLVCLLSAPLLAFATTVYHDDEGLYLEALARAPEQAWTHGFLGLHYRREGECQRAIPLLAHADQLDSTDARYLTSLGHCLVETHQLDAALAVGREGERRFRDTRQEAAFLFIQAVCLPPPELDRIEQLLTRCLVVYPGRQDCADALDQARALRGRAAP
ncbi:MAG: hypothetical protein R3B40_01675 [Polyangiales bacterium]